jgi:hypothetical protein
MSPSELVPERKQNLTSKQFIEQARALHEMSMQKLLALYICGALSVTTLATVVLFYLQGFHAFGFQLDNGTMHWLGVATIGEIASLAGIVYGAFFRQSGKRHNSIRR